MNRVPPISVESFISVLNDYRERDTCYCPANKGHSGWITCCISEAYDRRDSDGGEDDGG